MNNDKSWELKKLSFVKVLEDFALRSPVFEVLGVEDFGDELRTLVRFNTQTLVKERDGEIITRGPVMVGVRYHESCVSTPPLPWEIATVLEPGRVFHPNVNAAGAICLGHPPANMPLGEILHTTWAALVLNMKLVNTIDWQIFNREAAIYVRANCSKFPITPRGLLEPLDSREPSKKEPKA
ncbi:MAG: hypothetical protein HY000_39775 [Planctomycetes bacterium]|nr:hypothetical protein [Planctomycetota bacterium]